MVFNRSIEPHNNTNFTSKGDWCATIAQLRQYVAFQALHQGFDATLPNRIQPDKVPFKVANLLELRLVDLMVDREDQQ